MATQWENERVQTLAQFWNQGLRAGDIALKMSGFETYRDGGTGAVLGKASQMRKAAGNAGNLAEQRFWTRGKNFQHSEPSLTPVVRRALTPKPRFVGKIAERERRSLITATEPAVRKESRTGNPAMPLSQEETGNTADLPASVIAAIESMYPKS